MIAYIQGQCVHIGTGSVVLSCGGVGYEVLTTEETIKEIKNDMHAKDGTGVPTLITMWTHHVVREDTADLYGFTERKNLHMFNLLLNVNGVGPKTALNILNVASAEAIEQGILGGDASHFSRTTGIGKKTAEKILFSLTGKISALEELQNPQHKEHEETIDALKALGYQERHIREVLKDADTTHKTTADIVKFALKKLSRT